MTQIPAGWYPDPDPEAPEPRGRRWWDGERWTEHLAPAAQPAPQPTYPAQQPSGQGGYGQYEQSGQYGQRSYDQGGYGQQPYGAGQYGRQYAEHAAAGSRDATPDGEVLAGWGRRLAAFVLDAVIVGLVSLPLGFPWLREVSTQYAAFLEETLRATQGGGDAPAPGGFAAALAGPLAALAAVRLLVGFVYHVGFLKWRAATPGKMALGLRVRLRETPGPLTWGTVLKRWAGQFWYSVVGLVPFAGGLAQLWPLVDGLWPLWDSKRQALHDKIAATNVVRTR